MHGSVFLENEKSENEYAETPETTAK